MSMLFVAIQRFTCYSINESSLRLNRLLCGTDIAHNSALRHRTKEVHMSSDNEVSQLHSSMQDDTDTFFFSN